MNAPEPNICHRVVTLFGCYEEVTADEIFAIIRDAPSKQSCIDPISTWLVKQMADVLMPAIMNMISRSNKVDFHHRRRKPLLDQD